MKKEKKRHCFNCVHCDRVEFAKEYPFSAMYYYCGKKLYKVAKAEAAQVAQGCEDHLSSEEFENQERLEAKAW